MAHSLLEGAAFFATLQNRIEAAQKKALTKAAKVVQAEAKRVLGTYDYG
jgi:hypothetical protein